MENIIIIAETERLILRRYKKEDLQDLFEYLSDKEVVRYEPYKPLTLDEAKENLVWRIGTDEMIAVEFWKLLALYISSNTLSSIPWAIPFGDKEIHTMLNQAKDVLGWYDNMQNPIPTWYFKG